MAQTKRKRQTKHRGNAAGVVESRGRTSRPPSEAERKQADRAAARERRQTQKPTWRGALSKTLLMGGFMFIILTLFSKEKGADKFIFALIPAVLAVALYWPASYYLEVYMWRKRTGQQTGGLFASIRRK